MLEKKVNFTGSRYKDVVTTLQTISVCILNGTTLFCSFFARFETPNIRTVIIIYATLYTINVIILKFKSKHLLF